MHPDSWRYRGCLIFLVYHICPVISQVAVLVYADTYPGMTLCESLPYGMAGITIVGYLVRLCHPERD